MSKLQPVRNFRRLTRFKRCGNCRHLKRLEEEEDTYIGFECARPVARPGRAGRPRWVMYLGMVGDTYGDIWSCVCDRWSRK